MRRTLKKLLTILLTILPYLAKLPDVAYAEVREDVLVLPPVAHEGEAAIGDPTPYPVADRRIASRGAAGAHC